MLIRLISICFFFLMILCTNSNILAATINLDDQSGGQGSIVMFTVSIDRATNNVATFGCEIEYDPLTLKFRECTAGELTSNFNFFNAVNTSPGLVRLGGFTIDSSEIKYGDSGSVATLTFEVVGHNDCQVSLTNLKDNIKTWDTRSGSFIGDHVVEEKINKDLRLDDQIQENNKKIGVIMNKNAERSYSPVARNSDSISNQSHLFHSVGNTDRPSPETHLNLNKNYPTSTLISKSEKTENNVMESLSTHGADQVVLKRARKSHEPLSARKPDIDQLQIGEPEGYSVVVSASNRAGHSPLRLIVRITFLTSVLFYAAIGISVLFLSYFSWKYLRVLLPWKRSHRQRLN